MWASSMEISNSTVPHRSHGAPTSPQPSLGRVPSLRAASARAAAIHLVQLAPKEHQKVAGRRSPLYLLTVFSDLLPSLQREILAQAVLHFGRALDPYTYEVLVDPRWRSVQLAGHLHATDGALRPFLRCRKLESIVLSGCRKVSPKLVTQLVSQQRGDTLWRLDLASSVATGAADDLARTIATVAPRLTQLSLSHTVLLTDKGVAAIARGCSGLVKLDVSYCQHVTAIPLSELPALQELDVSGTEVGSDGVGGETLPHLRVLRATLSAVGDAFVSALLCQHPGPLTELDVSACAVTGTVLCDVARLRDPATVSLAGIRSLHWGSVQQFALEVWNTLHPERIDICPLQAWAGRAHANPTNCSTFVQRRRQEPRSRSSILVICTGCGSLISPGNLYRSRRSRLMAPQGSASATTRSQTSLPPATLGSRHCRHSAHAEPPTHQE
eukprot:m.92244 g.92244  ORF g.92244 m.92244 type:complete len:441 (-) comp20226_c0_seq3:1693-3015(-)